MKKISLSQKEFKSSIAKGRGLIIQFLKQISPATEKYDELIKWGCMNLTNLSMQDDGPNEEYYFDIINLSGLKDKIVSGMISYVSEYWAIHCSKDIEDKDFNSYYKVFCILCLFAKYDHELSDILQATYKKIFFYSDIITQNPIIKLMNNIENFIKIN